MKSFICFAAFAVTICYGQIGQAVPGPNSVCARRNSYTRIEGSCDSYIECKDYIAHEMLCPDGLHYNPDAPWPAYPCSYPTEVSCEGRGNAQQPITTAECPHLYGFFPSPLAAANDCGQYRMCVEGRAIEMTCPVGLAFNPVTARCDWPAAVPSCNAEAFLGFQCPAMPLGEDGQPLDIVMNYKYEGSCYDFFSCEQGRARLLRCDVGFAFDPVTGHCEDADKVQCKN